MNRPPGSRLPDGTEDLTVSAGGDRLLKIVRSFTLNATFTPVRDKADRLPGGGVVPQR